MNTSEHEKAIKLIKARHNILITGPAGTGKSYLIKDIKNWANFQDYNIAITAMTGIASFIIGGTTLHSWAGIGLGDKPAEYLANKIKKNFHTKMKWWKTKILVIDEVSMLTAELFEKLEYIGRLVRGNEKPFGGIQLVLSGDFCQLPPIDKQKEAKFCFESSKWDSCIYNTITFNKIFRQDDPVLQYCLNEIRMGRCPEDVKNIINDRLGKEYNNDNGIKPTKLYSHRASVNNFNQEQLKKLNSDIISFDATYEIANYTKMPTPKQREKTLSILDKNAPYDTHLQLALGAQVVLLVNLDIDNGLVNGSRGVITNFRMDTPIVKFVNGMEIPIISYSWEHEGNPTYIRKQIPLKLAWATTIHKSQGQTLDLVEIDIGDNIFECGQTYVAMSRVKTLEGLFINSFNPDKIRTNPKVIDFYNVENFKQIDIS